MMALVNIDTVLSELQRYLSKCPVGGGVEVMSYKRNRSVAVVKRSIKTYLIKEAGYDRRDFVVHEEELRKKMKMIIKKEFPRSRKLRLFKFQEIRELDRTRQKI